MTHHNKASRVAKMIEEMMDIKLRPHDREHHFKGDAKEFAATFNRVLLIKTSCAQSKSISLVQ
jgi:hypothetical protein